MYDDLNLYIDGEWRPASDKGTKPVTDPANEEQLATIATATETDIDAALKAAERGFEVWRKTGTWERAAMIRKVADLIRERVEQIAVAMSLETGKPLAEAKGETGALLERAAEAEVAELIAIGGSVEANGLARRLAGEHPGRIFASAGYDRDLAGTSPDLEALKTLLAEAPVVAVGETGLDYHYGAEQAPEQRTLLDDMLQAAIASSKPGGKQSALKK